MSQHDRQSFLGSTSEQDLAGITVGIVGLGGGGSHVVQQLAHLGVGGYVIVDPDTIDETNLNRLVGGTRADVDAKEPKVRIAERTIRRVLPHARISAHASTWQEVAGKLKHCDVIIGGLDSVIAKDQIDGFSKRFLIPYVDMGMDVHKLGDRFLIAGQVVLTMPGGPCLRCMGVVTEAALATEARLYGAAGGKPQVVWPNGILASTAVGLFTQLVCPWHDKPMAAAYLEYDGNKHTVAPSMRLAALAGRSCSHHHVNETGEPRFDVRNPPAPMTPQAGASVAVDSAAPAWWRAIVRFFKGR
jgi:molybdopterin/thiamine biosynthesis adenylyltransferase